MEFLKEMESSWIQRKRIGWVGTSEMEIWLTFWNTIAKDKVEKSKKS